MTGAAARGSGLDGAAGAVAAPAAVTPLVLALVLVMGAALARGLAGTAAAACLARSIRSAGVSASCASLALKVRAGGRASSMWPATPEGGGLAATDPADSGAGAVLAIGCPLPDCSILISAVPAPLVAPAPLLLVTS